MNRPTKHWIRRGIAAAKLVLFALLCWFIYYTFASANETLYKHTWHIEPAWLILSGVFYLLGILPAAVFWQRVMVHTGQHVRLFDGVRAYYISQLGKYVPGKWMVILLRRVLVPGETIEDTVAAASVFFETFTMLAVGAALSVVVLVIWHSHQHWLIAAAVGSLFLMGVPTVPVVFRWLLNVLGVVKLNPTVAAKFRHIGPRTIVLGWIGISVGWTFQGLSLWATLRGMDAPVDGPFHELSLHTATVALSVVAGFISQLPGGLGMRETVSAQLVEPQYGPVVAVVSAIIFRMVLLVSEVAISIILYAAGWRQLRKSVKVLEAELAAPANS